MNLLGEKIAKKRKDLGMTQNDFADKLMVTRQTISRWEAGTVLPDIDKISDIANLLNVSCDYLLKDEISEENKTQIIDGPGKILSEALGKKIRLRFLKMRRISISMTRTASSKTLKATGQGSRRKQRKGSLRN